ncbi:MAG: hypothetical protein WBP57_05085 [Ignavibacteria bacterium]
MSHIYQIAAFVLLVSVVLYFTVYKELRGRGFMPWQRKLLKTGIPARAKVLRIHHSNNYFGCKSNTHQFEEIEIALEVKPLNSAGYTVNTTRIVPVNDTHTFVIGREIDVKIKPGNADKIVIVGFDG